MENDNENEIVNTTQGENAKKKHVRYDRQLRLWGELGQEAIENVKLGVLGSNSTAGESLKNLVLPGIGEYTVIDNAKVTERDLGNNFYLTKDSKGTSRATELVKNLNEMNPFVKGSAKEEDPVKLVEENVEYFKEFNVLLTCQQPAKTVNKLAKFAWENGIPLFVARSYGFLGYLRVAVPELTIYENHEKEFKDLRLNDPFPEFVEFCDKFDIDVNQTEENKKLNEKERLSVHADVPWLILAPRLKKRWQEANPNKQIDESAFQAFVRQARLENPEKKGQKAIEENYDELVANSWLVAEFEDYYDIPEAVQEVLDDDKTNNVGADSDKFWVLAAALKRFIAKEGQGKHLPLTGALPDMHGATNNYLALQTVFKEKSKSDLAAFEGHLDDVVKSVGKFNKFESFRKVEVERFFKNARFIEVQRYRSVEQEQAWNAEEFNMVLAGMAWDANAKNLVWYLLLRAVDAFFEKNGRYPGDTDETFEADIKALQELAKQLGKESGINFDTIENLDDYAHEMARYGAAELHNIAAVVGGTVAQELIKLVAGQWVALNNSWVFSGIDSSSLQFKA